MGVPLPKNVNIEAMLLRQDERPEQKPKEIWVNVGIVPEIDPERDLWLKRPYRYGSSS